MNFAKEFGSDMVKNFNFINCGNDLVAAFTCVMMVPTRGLGRNTTHTTTKNTIPKKSSKIR